MPRFDIPTWQMIRNAMIELGRPAKPKEILRAIQQKYPEVNPSTVNTQITFCSVNANSRVNGPENQQVRDYIKNIDVLYRLPTGGYDLYDPLRHGRWGIRHDEHGKYAIYNIDLVNESANEESNVYDSLPANELKLRLQERGIVGYQWANKYEMECALGFHGEELQREYENILKGYAVARIKQQRIDDFENPTKEEDPEDPVAFKYAFRLEAQLRDSLAASIDKFEVFGKKISLYIGESGQNGIEYPTPVGIIDILAKDADDNIYVFELKLTRGADAALGQIQRYMGWVKKHLAKDSAVHGIIIAESIDEKLKYAASVAVNIRLMEYEMSFAFSEVKLD